MSTNEKSGWHVDVFQNILPGKVVAESKRHYCLLVFGDLKVVPKDNFFEDYQQACWRAMNDAQVALDAASDRMRQVCKKLTETPVEITQPMEEVNERNPY